MTEVVSADRVRPRLRRVLIVVVVVLIPLASHAIWDQVEATRLAHAIAAIAHRGEPVNVAFRRSALPTAENRRAARFYASAANLASWRLRDDAPLGSRDDDVDRAFASGRPAAVLEDVQHRYVDDEPALELLAKASALDFRGFGSIDPSLYRNSSPLEALNQLNDLKADVLIARGQGNEAADTLIQSVRLQRTMALEFYRSIAWRSLYGSVRLLLRYAAPDAEGARRLQQAVEAVPDADDMAAQIQMQRAEILGEIWPYPPDAGSWALRPQRSIRDGGSSLAFLGLRPLLTRAMRAELQPFEEAIDVARQPWPGRLEAAHALAGRYGVSRNAPSQRAFLDRAVGFIPPALGVWELDYYVTTIGTDLAIRRTAIAALAIERFRRAHDGVPPASLQALVPDYIAAVPVDPFSGMPLVYHTTADHYDVYSIDSNRIDDGGAFYGFGTGAKSPIRLVNNQFPRDIGIRVPLAPVH
jgi:hypothetical protein